MGNVPEFIPKWQGMPPHMARREGPRCVCGHWPGRHRWGDNACPNPKWRCGNGQAQWLTQTYARGDAP